jgi:transcriptional regulator with XRE-family HTH domain|tara:strand:+ start:474 stop:833 length:360 start_codon:yes stop_codon:yes gene_type:complete
MDSKKLEVGARIKQLRSAQEKTLREVGLELNVAANTVNRWERGESAPTRANLISLSNLFAVDPSWLMFGITKSNTKNNEEVLIRKIRLLSKQQFDAVETMIDLLAGQEEGMASDGTTGS